MKSQSKRILIVAFLLLTLLVIGLSSYRYMQEQKEIKSIPIINKDISLEKVREYTQILKQRKVNIYLFYGDGCPHCEDLMEYLESIKDKYGKYYTLYAFEVWSNQENGELMDKFTEKFGGQVGSRSVPYYIIGDEVMSGYVSSMSTKVKDKILEKYKDRKNLDDFQEILNN